MKDIKDYLPFYIGCECMIGDLKWKREEFTYGLAPAVDLDYGKPIKSKIDSHVLNAFAHKTTPILRRLSDKNMSSAELLEWHKRRQRKGWMPGVHADNTKWLLSRGFDLFGLIDSGLAIEKQS